MFIELYFQYLCHYLQQGKRDPLRPSVPFFITRPDYNLWVDGSLPNLLNFSLSIARFADEFSSTFFCISNYLANAFLASSTKASSTFIQSFADVSIWFIPSPRFFDTYSASSAETYRFISKSFLLPSTMNGKVSGLTTILFYKNEFFQLSILSSDARLVTS